MVSAALAQLDEAKLRPAPKGSPLGAARLRSTDRVAREKLRLVWRHWHQAASESSKERLLKKSQGQALKLLRLRSSMSLWTLLRFLWQTWQAEVAFGKVSDRRDDQLRRLGFEASEALRSVWSCGQALVLLRSWHFYACSQRLEGYLQRLDLEMYHAHLQNDVLARANAARSYDLESLFIRMVFSRWKTWLRIWCLRIRMAQQMLSGTKKLCLVRAWLLWQSALLDCRRQKVHEAQAERLSNRLKAVSIQALQGLQLLTISSACTACFHAWASVLVDQRHLLGRLSDKEKRQEWIVHAWHQQSCRTLGRTAFQGWCAHCKERRVIHQLKQLTEQLTEQQFKQKSERDLKNSLVAWHSLVSIRLQGLHRLQLFQRGRVILHMAFRCWRYSMVALVEQLGTRSRGREQVLSAVAMTGTLQKLRCFMAWRQQRSARRVAALLGKQAKDFSQRMLLCCFGAWRIEIFKAVNENLGLRVDVAELRGQILEGRFGFLTNSLRGFLDHRSNFQTLKLRRLAFFGWRSASAERLSERQLLLRSVRAWNGLALQRRRRHWAEVARQARYLLRHCVSAWRKEISERHRQEAQHYMEENLRLSQRQGEAELWFRLLAIFSRWRHMLSKKKEVWLQNRLLLSFCIRGWVQSYSNRRYLVATKTLQALERLCSRLLRRRNQKLRQEAFRAWRVALRLRCQVKFQERSWKRTRRTLMLTQTFHAWRTARGHADASSYAYSLLMKCLGHRTLMELVFRAWRTLREVQPSDASGAEGPIQDEMLELCKCLETQNADLLLLLEERCNANSLLELELGSKGPVQYNS